MSGWKIKIDNIKKYGVPYNLVASRDFDTSECIQIKKGHTCFVVKTEFEPPGSIKAGEVFFCAFSNVCTHMGCKLIRDKSNNSLEYSGTEEKLICGPCPCHGTTFDLTKQGLVVLGPATQNLPQLHLELLPEDKPEFLISNKWRNHVDPNFENWPE